MKKIIFASILVITILVVGVACSSTPTNGSDASPGEDDLVLTMDELAEYDGKDGNPAYILVEGIIYDVTDSDLWEEGEHNGFEAGQDLTEGIINDSPHGTSVLDRMPVVGRIAD